MPAELGYWKIRGLAQPIRLLLHYVGEEFEDKLYEITDGPEFNRDAWFKVKFTKGLDYPNLPYFIDGDIKITQSNAILRYIGRKHNLCGSTEQERVYVDIMENEAMDFRNGFVRLCYNPKFESLKGDYLKNVPNKIEQFEKFLEGKKFFAGEKVTFVDFHMYEMFDQHMQLDPSLFDNTPNIKAFQKRFEELPAIKAFMSSDKFQKLPLNNKSAAYGGSL